MKKFLSLVLALIMTMSLVTISAGAKGFTDADEVNYDEAIDVLSALKVVEGYPDESFKPAKTLTRAEAAKIICNMILGPTTAANLSASVAPFSDVAADNWAAGYITYCAQQGIISGYGNGAFGPTDTLTGYQFMKMLLGALGYDAKVEGYVGTNYSIPVAKQALSIGLNKGLKETFNGNNAVTREEACLYALNTLKADLVEYSTSLTVNNGALDTLNVAKAQQWNNSATKIENIKADNYIQFAEQYFPKLELEVGNGIYGRPTNVWKLKKAEIGAYTSIESTYVYTESTDGDDVYKDLGKVVCNEKEYDWTAYINGVEQDDAIVPVKGMKEWAYTGEGTVTEIYVDDDAETVTVIEINYYLGQVSKVKSDDDGEYITVNLVSQGAKLNDRTFYVEGYDEDDYVVFTVDYNDDNDYVIGEVCEPEVVEAEVTRVDTDKDTGATYLRTSEGKYTYTEDASEDDKQPAQQDHMVYDLDKTNEKDHPALNEDYNLYLDPNGYVLGFEKAEEEVNQYLYVTDADEHLGTWEAKVVLADGTSPKVELKKGLKDIPGNPTDGFQNVNNGNIGWVDNSIQHSNTEANIVDRIWKYTKSDKGVYTLYYVENIALEDADIHNGKAYITEGVNSYIVDKKTVFVDVDGETAYTGYKEVPNIENAEGALVMTKNVGVIAFITDGDIYDTNNIYFMLLKNTRESLKYDGEYYWDYSKAYVNGEKQNVIVNYDWDNDGTNDDALEAGVLYKVKKVVDEKYIVEVEEVDEVVAAGEPYAVGDEAFWITDEESKTVKFDTDEETVYVTVEYAWDAEDEEYDLDSISAGNLKDMKQHKDAEGNYDDYGVVVAVVKATNDDNTARLVYTFLFEIPEVVEEEEEPVDCMVGFWQASPSGNVCFAFYDKEGHNLTQRQLLDLGLKAEDFTITINGKSFTGKTMTNISSDVGLAALKVKFGEANTVLVPGDQFVIDADGNALATNNIKFSFSIKGINYTLESGSIEIPDAQG